MADIRIVREHGLGLAKARELAARWAEVARNKLQVECSYEVGEAEDVLRFRRPGASGELRVDGARFQLHARLGLLLGVFKARIESEIVRNLDALLAQEDPLKAFDEGVAQHEAKRAAKHAKTHPEPHRHAAKPARRP